MSAFEHSALWSKTKMFLDRALAARDNSDDVGYHLWAAAAMEVLGKAALSFIHPTLVADPSHIHSLMMAAGRPVGSEHRSITARTLFERLPMAIAPFDKKMSDECMHMANRRNAELHSGETPIVGLNIRNWVPQYWRSVNVLVNSQGKNLDDLVGPDEAARVREILRDAAELTRQTVLARIQRRRGEIDARFARDVEERTAAERRASARPLPPQYQELAEGFEEAACPACGMKGWMFGSISGEEINEVVEDIDVEYEKFGPLYFEVLETTHAVEEFRCPECTFRVSGRDEVKIAGLPAEFTHQEEREPDYEPDYGND